MYTICPCRQTYRLPYKVLRPLCWKYLPKILSAHAIKHEIDAKIRNEKRIEDVLQNDC